MLGHKEKLADAIYNDVTPIVVPPVSAVDLATLAKRRTVAANLLRRQLLVNLVEGFDVETIIQSSVEVSVDPSGSATFATAPRLVGQPVVSEILDPGDHRQAPPGNPHHQNRRPSARGGGEDLELYALRRGNAAASDGFVPHVPVRHAHAGASTRASRSISISASTNWNMTS